MLVKFTFKSATGHVVKETQLNVRSTQATETGSVQLASEAFKAAKLNHFQIQAVQTVEISGISKKPIVHKKHDFEAALL